jgi:hypothetical protein
MAIKMERPRRGSSVLREIEERRLRALPPKSNLRHLSEDGGHDPRVFQRSPPKLDNIEASSKKTRIITRLEEGDVGGVFNHILELIKMGTCRPAVDADLREVSDLVLGPDAEIGGKAAFVLNRVASRLDLTFYVSGMIPLLEEALASENGTVVRYSVNTLGSLASYPRVQIKEESLDLIMKLFSHPDESARREAHCTLVGMSKEDSRVLEKLEALARDPEKVASVVEELDAALRRYLMEKTYIGRLTNVEEREAIPAAISLRVLAATPEEIVKDLVGGTLEAVKARQNA